MDNKTFEHLCVLSKLSFDDESAETTRRQLDGIIALMDKVKAIDLTYDDTLDKNEVPFASLRADKAEEPFSPERLLSNTQPKNDCYVIPKMMNVE
ncbi:MAG: aspartyl/glutamyl-tRNA amidotransferase subunit C [Oscillospiraceae bacterium]|jgi:aspartyl/glutamyl-tRNA(Asn/Gln) amidotransferase C subunit|nr:aspartyl/glutamyl-tRNA amidotransferase subunit C [Oscillospiraceae bacterium]